MIKYQFNADREAAGKAIGITGSGAINRVPESTILIPTTELYNPGSWMRHGDSPSEIILAMAVFVGILSKRR